MAVRPYFNKGIAELEELFQQNKNNKAILEMLEHELKHRDRPKAKALEKSTKKCLAELARNEGEASASASIPSVGVECAHCGETNYVSTREGVTQHLSCSFCRTPYEAVFKFNVLRTKFPPKPIEQSATNYGLIAFVLIAIAATTFFFLKK